MPDFRVTWTIDIDASDHEDAAREARRMQLDPESVATVFRVTDRTAGGRIRIIDLAELP